MLNLQLNEIKSTESFTRFTYKNLDKFSEIKKVEIEYQPITESVLVLFYNKNGDYLPLFDETSFRAVTQPLSKKVIRLHKNNFI